VNRTLIHDRRLHDNHGSTRFRLCRGQRAQLYYEEAGNGHPLLLIHGGLVHSDMWDDQFEAFAQHFRVIRFDLRGFGKSFCLPANTPFTRTFAACWTHST
jgi:pimeloyl-ACP methyl ester carboxylesterase